MHQIRDIEAHRRNTWLWDEWGFTADWDNGCTLSDIDGFYPHFAEVSGRFLIIEVKSWNNQPPKPEVNYSSGQAKALFALSKDPKFTIIWAWGDTATQTIYDYEVWTNGGVNRYVIDFKDFLNRWFKYARGSLV